MIGPDEATSALKIVEHSRRYAGELRRYADSGSTLIAWGLTWLVGNLGNQFRPTLAQSFWLVGISAAALWSMTRRRRPLDWRVLATVAAIVGYMLVMLVIVRANARAAGAAISLLVAASYIVVGAWTGIRFAILGLALSVVVLIGWFVVPAWLFACLATGGGGTLLLGGVWLRRA